MSETKTKNVKKKISKQYLEEALEDFRIACISREVSLLGRKEVLRGKAKFGIFGAGKEVAQCAMARVFKKGDFRSGYYRDQTFMLASGLCTVENLYAQLYAHADAEHEPFSAGRQMNSHFATTLIDENGNWTNHTNSKNVSADISPTGGQMARALGLALASKVYRQNKEIMGIDAEKFSVDGNEVSFCTIGDASTSEGVFWETLNAAGVLQVPLAVFVWDDGYGISVPREFQTTKGSISEVLSGFNPGKGETGVTIYTVKAWDYLSLRTVFEDAIKVVRKTHGPCLFHVQECTQPQGHSTSGSHERYKDEARLNFEKEFDGIAHLKNWLVEQGAATEAELTEVQATAQKEVKASISNAWKHFEKPIKERIATGLELINNVLAETNEKNAVAELQEALAKAISPIHKDVIRILRNVLRVIRAENYPAKTALEEYVLGETAKFKELYTSKLYSDSNFAALEIAETKPIYTENSPIKSGYEILNACFDYHLANNPAFLAFGEDVGQIGDVNQGFMGMQEKYGVERVFDTGIREWTIIGQAIGMAMRGLRPLAEIQYLDYLIYALSALSDDMATLRYRSNSIQKAPAIIRTRGHRLEGIWHSGSPIGFILGSLRGICVLVPRDMTRAVGFYNTMLQSDDPCLVIECLNGYRLKEQMPDNLSEFTVPVGVPEVLQTGTDLTLVTYGSCIRVAEEAIQLLEEAGISVELIDVQSLLPFDVHHQIVESVKKTNRLVVLDEDVSGGASAYLLQKILVEQKAYYYLDSEPVTISAEDVRTAYGSDADYFIKPSVEDVFEKVYALMYESDPQRFDKMYFI